MSATRVKCGGVWLDTLGYVGELSWSTVAPAGTSSEASWSMSLDPLFEHPAVRRGKRVEIFVGPQRIWRGLLNDPTPGEGGWSFEATGLKSEAEDYMALKADGSTTSVPNTAVDQAIARGLPWTRPDSLSGSALKTGDDTEAVNPVGALLDDWAEGAGKRWGVNAAGQVVAVADPTSPTWVLHSDVVLSAVADDEYVTHLYGRYKSGSSPDTFATVSVGNAAQADRFGRVEEDVDLTPLGVISSGTATTMLQGMLDLCGARLSWSGGLEVAASELATRGGAGADLRFVQGGQLVRVFGVLARDGSKFYSDFHIGEARYVDGESSIQLTPVDLAPRDLAGILSVEAPEKGKKKRRRRRRRRLRG